MGPDGGDERRLQGTNARRIPIRLAFFVDSMKVGGSELNAIRTLEQLDRHRFALSVFHTGSHGPLLARYQALGVPLHHVRVTGFIRFGTLAAGLGVARALHSGRIQILHTHDIYSNILAVPCARLAGVPVIIASRRWQGAIPGRGHALANRVASRWATRVLANSVNVARTVIQEDGVPAESVKVIPNFVAACAFEPYPATERARLFAELGIPTGSLVIGAVARLSAIKDHATLLRAAEPLLAEWPELHLLLVGDGPLGAALQAQAAATGQGARIHFAGQLPNQPNPHALFDVSVLCSLTEGFPNAVVEAMAAGKPVVATAVGGVPEAVREGESGLLVPPADPAALTRALRELLEAPERRLALGQAGRQRALTEYSAAVVLANLSDWYEGLVAAG